MMARKFSFGEASAKNASRGLLDIPHTSILKTYTPEELVDNFEALWGARPHAVALPVTNADGLLFDVDGLSGRSNWSSGYKGGLNDFSAVVHRFASLDMDIYLTLDPTLSFLSAPPIQIVDIVGDSARQLCFGNPTVHQIAGAVLGTGIDLTLTVLDRLRATKKSKLLGVVLDLVNLWPMSGDQNRLELTCFCPSCQRYFDGHKKGKNLVDKFKNFPNPWNLILNATRSGIDFVDEIGVDQGAKEILGFCRLKGFDAAFGEDVSDGILLKMAESLLGYMSVRHDQVVFAAEEVFSVALDGLGTDDNKYVAEASRDIKRVILVEGTRYSWTSGLYLEKLDKSAPRQIDHLWIDKGPLTPILEKVPTTTYMSRRSRYFVDAFFDFIASATNANSMATTGLGRKQPEEVKLLLVHRMMQALASLSHGRPALGTLGTLSTDMDKGLQGYIGCAFDEKSGEELIQGISIAQGRAT